MTDGKIAVSELFHTIQGEGAWTGTPSVFVRLQFCDIGCPWCDTKYTWDLNEADRTERLTNEKGKWKAYTWDSLEQMILQHIELNDLRARHIVFTGGEPCAYDLTKITSSLKILGFTTQIETSGTYPIRCSEETYITVSPKIDMPGGREVLYSALRRANEIKMPVGKTIDVIKLQELLNRHQITNKLVYLQPLSRSLKATDLCVNACYEYGYRLSVQVHQYIGLP